GQAVVHLDEPRLLGDENLPTRSERDVRRVGQAAEDDLLLEPGWKPRRMSVTRRGRRQLRRTERGYPDDNRQDPESPSDERRASHRVLCPSLLPSLDRRILHRPFPTVDGRSVREPQT